MSAVVQYDSMLKNAHYLAMIALEPFVFAGQRFIPPRDLAISPTFWRDYTCPAGCGGCCPAFTMDFWRDEWEAFGEWYPYRTTAFQPYAVEVNGVSYTYLSNRHTALARFKAREFCQFLDNTGRCELHNLSPFSCQFELNKLQFFPRRDRCILGKKVFRNGWRYQRRDGGQGALCQMIPISAETIARVHQRDVPLLRALARRADKLNIRHRGWCVVAALEKVKVNDDIRMSTV